MFKVKTEKARCCVVCTWCCVVCTSLQSLLDLIFVEVLNVRSVSVGSGGLCKSQEVAKV